MTDVLFSSVLLDQQRWTPKKIPAIRFSEYYDPVMSLGVSGIELWEFHYTHADADEQAFFEREDVLTPVFNAYCGFDDAEEARRMRILDIASRTGARGIKFNLGPDADRWEEYKANFVKWREKTPADITLLCECHPGTVIEEAVDAERFFNETGFDQLELIVHPFSRFESLPEWFERFGNKVSHLHLQMRDAEEDEVFVRYDRRPDIVEQAFEIIHHAGFRGSYALEFAEGTRTPRDNPDTLMSHATADYHLIRERI